jgi:Fe-S oxidoreductase
MGQLNMLSEKASLLLVDDHTLFHDGLLAGYPQMEMPSRGVDTICCGSGEIVSAVDPDLCPGRASCRLAEFSASGADACVTSCMACAHRLARAGVPGQVRHCQEYVFGLAVD